MQAVKVLNTTSYTPVGTPSKSITYLTLGTTFAAGTLLINTGVTNGGKGSFNFTLPAVQFARYTCSSVISSQPHTDNSSYSIVQTVAHPISPLIYGVNFPPSASYVHDLGVTMARWGGNAVTAYNPAGQFTNAGNDWFFENRVADPPDADAWVGWVKGAGASTLLTVPSCVVFVLSLLSRVIERKILGWTGSRRTRRRTRTPPRSTLVSLFVFHRVPPIF